MEIGPAVGEAAVIVSESVGAHCIVSIEKKVHEAIDEDSPFYMDIKVGVFRKVKDKVYAKEEYTTKIKKPEQL